MSAQVHVLWCVDMLKFFRLAHDYDHSCTSIKTYIIGKHKAEKSELLPEGKSVASLGQSNRDMREQTQHRTKFSDSQEI